MAKDNNNKNNPNQLEEFKISDTQSRGVAQPRAAKVAPKSTEQAETNESSAFQAYPHLEELLEENNYEAAIAEFQQLLVGLEEQQKQASKAAQKGAFNKATAAVERVQDLLEHLYSIKESL